MKKRTLFFGVITLSLLSSCKKSIIRNTCIEADKTTVRIEEIITVSNCGDRELPNSKLDWGDGTERESGLDGTHKYGTAGYYEIRIFLNDRELNDGTLRIPVYVNE
jgi:hypothetical protein